MIDISTIVTIFVTLLSFLSSQLPLADSIAHFRFHLVCLLSLLTVIQTFVRGIKLAGWMALFVAYVYLSIWSAMPPSPADENRLGLDLKLMQLNLSFANRTLQQVMQLVEIEQPDVITLQEVNGRTKQVMHNLKNEYPYRKWCSFASVGGVAVLSRIPIENVNSWGCKERLGLVWIKLRKQNKIFSLVSIHLYWPFPYRQHWQIDQLETQLQTIPRPIILAGDFNAAPWSYAVHRIAQATNTQVVGGRRASFDLSFHPYLPSVGLPIDHVLLPPGAQVQKIYLGPKVGSDHHSVFARIRL